MKKDVEKAWNDALLVLGLTGEEDLALIRSRYRALVHRDHPDENRGGERRGADIGAYSRAYRFLASHWEERNREGAQRRHWPDEEDPALPVIRTIYEQQAPWDLEGPLWRQPLVRGRYRWNPALEDFSMLLFSLRSEMAAMTAFGEAAGADPAELFYLLAAAHVDPLEALEKLAWKEERDEKTVYALKASTQLPAKAGEKLFPVRVETKTRRALIVRNVKGQEDVLSFDEDWANFACLPLAAGRKAGLLLQVLKENGRKKAASVLVQLIVPEREEVLAFLRERQERILGKLARAKRG